MASHEPDRDPLLKAACSRDPSAFDDLIAELRGGLKRYLRHVGSSLFGPDFDEDDAAQITLDKAWRLLPEFEVRDRATFERWLRALARGVLADRARYRGARGRAAQRHLESIFDQAAEVQGRSLTASQIARRFEAVDRASLALGALHPRERVVVELHLLEARSLADIAGRLGLSKNAVFERLHRGLAHLRRSLGHGAPTASSGALS